MENAAERRRKSRANIERKQNGETLGVGAHRRRLHNKSLPVLAQYNCPKSTTTLRVDKSTVHNLRALRGGGVGGGTIKIDMRSSTPQIIPNIQGMNRQYESDGRQYYCHKNRGDDVGHMEGNIRTTNSATGQAHKKYGSKPDTDVGVRPNMYSNSLQRCERPVILEPHADCSRALVADAVVVKSSQGG